MVIFLIVSKASNDFVFVLQGLGLIVQSSFAIGTQFITRYPPIDFGNDALGRNRGRRSSRINLRLNLQFGSYRRRCLFTAQATVANVARFIGLSAIINRPNFALWVRSRCSGSDLYAS